MYSYNTNRYNGYELKDLSELLEKTFEDNSKLQSENDNMIRKIDSLNEQIIVAESKIDLKLVDVSRIMEDLGSRDSFRNTGKQMENIRAMDEKAATEMAKDDWKPIRHMFSDDFLETWGIGKGFEDPFEPKVTRGMRTARAGKSAVVGHKVDYSRPTYLNATTTPLDADQLQAYAEYHRDEGDLEPRGELPPAYIDYLQKREKWRQLFEKNPSGLLGTQYNADGGRAGYMGGGITGIRKPNAIPPERQGLRSIMINGKKS